MDIPHKKSVRTSRYLAFSIVAVLCALLLVGWMRINAYTNTNFVDRDSIVIDEVRRGDLIREVRAPGLLVPSDLRWVAATSASRVESILLDPGAGMDICG